jgi:hypothetical protein
MKTLFSRVGLERPANSESPAAYLTISSLVRNNVEAESIFLMMPSTPRRRYRRYVPASRNVPPFHLHQ